ncbi:MAG: phosphoglycolate phosphatase, partial [Oleispira sp.]
DTAPDFFPTVNTLRKEHNLPPLADDIIRLQVSNGGRALTRLALDMPLVDAKKQESTDLNDADTLFFEQQRQRLLTLYIDHIAEKSDLFPGMTELLETCEQYSLPWGIVTNKPRLYTEILLERLADRLPILAYCAVVVCPDDVDRTKPFPDPLYLAADTLKIPAHDCWYLGDHVRDIEAGNAASMFTIATLYGYIAPHDNPESWQADISVDSVEEITHLLTLNF